METASFDYFLPEELIASSPILNRTDSRLLIDSKPIQHKHFFDFIEFVNKDDLIVMNNTSVLPARVFGQKKTGGKFEMLLERLLDSRTALVQIKSSKAPKNGTILKVKKNQMETEIECMGRDSIFFKVDLKMDSKVFFNNFGQIPLPPYIKRNPNHMDKLRYKTVYENIDNQASVAAPTAGMHFSDLQIEKLKEKKIDIVFLNLNVGAGTFRPVTSKKIIDHKIHEEYINVSKDVVRKVKETKSKGGNVIAIGTTTLRAIETVFFNDLDEYSGLTDIFIIPGFKFKAVDKLITNFHLPKSSLLMLVAAFIGYERMKELYEVGVRERYRFLSYGDAMFLNKNEI